MNYAKEIKGDEEKKDCALGAKATPLFSILLPYLPLFFFRSASFIFRHDHKHPFKATNSHESHKFRACCFLFKINIG